MKKLKNLSPDDFDMKSQFSFSLVIAFLFLIYFSIFACYMIFCLLLINLFYYALKNRTLPPVPRYFKYFLLFILFTLISTIFSINRIHSLKDNREIFIFLMIPIFLLTIDSVKKLTISIITIFFSSFISSLLGIFFIIREGISLENRLKGFTSHWMTYSGLLMLIFIFFFIYIFYETKKNFRIFILILLALLLTNILFSQTRSVWVGIIISLILYISFFKPRMLIYIIPGILILITIIPESIKGRMFSIFDLQNSTNKDRIFMIHTGIKIFKDFPLTGVGANNVGKVYPKYRHRDAKQNNPHLHNNFIQILAERGICALISLTIAFISIFINLIIQIKKSSGMEKAITTAVLFVFIGFLIAGFFEYNFGDTEIKFLLFYFLSIPFLKLKEKQNAQTEPL